MNPVSLTPRFSGCFELRYQGKPLTLLESRSKSEQIEHAYDRHGDQNRVYCTMSRSDQTLHIVSGEDVRGYILTVLGLLQSPAPLVKQARELSLEALAPFVQANIAQWPLARRQAAADQYLADKTLQAIEIA